MFLFPLLLLLLAGNAGAVLHHNITVGAYTMVAYYDNKSTQFLLTSVSGNTLFIVGQQQGGISPLPTICQPQLVTRIVVGNAGCGPGVQSLNCATSTTEAQKNREQLEAYFSFPPESDECRSAVTNPQLSCYGPIYVNLPTTQGQQIPATNETLLLAKGVYVLSGYGYNCAAPTITLLDIQLPSLQVDTTTCVDSFNRSFAGTYAVFATEPLQRLYTYSSDYRRLDFTSDNRVSLRALDLTPYSFPVNLDTWVYSLPISFTNGSCSFNLSLVPIPKQLVLEPQEQVTASDYFYNKLPYPYETSLVCGFSICRLDQFGELADPYCPELAVKGGWTEFRTAGAISVPMHVPADASYDSYQESCDTFYPWGVTFAVYNVVTKQNDGTPLQARYVKTVYSCFAPFFYPAAIANLEQGSVLTNPRSYTEKYEQCFQLGGWLVGASGTHCQRQLDVQRCDRGWVYFDSYCYRYMDPIRDRQYQVSDTDADLWCAKFGTDVTVARGVPTSTRAWLQSFFVAYRRVTTGFPYRLPILSSGCVCMQVSSQWQGFSTTSGPGPVDVDGCVCSEPAFPICRYWTFSRPPPHLFVSMSPDTRRVLREGQVGVAWAGFSTQCNCYNGWAGYACQQPVCGLPSVDGSLEGNALNDFYTRCIFSKRGVCKNGDPRTCTCEPGWGPPASLTNASLTQWRDFPCACPAGSLPSQTGFQVNDIVYNSTIAVCGGTSNGYCTLENTTTLAYCVCTTRRNPWNQVLEEATTGKSCTCQTAMLFANNYELNGGVTTGYCNSHGTCCSSGEVQRNQRVSGQDVSAPFQDICFTDGLEPIEGCVCDNGWSGLSCTCPVPVDLAQGRQVFTETARAYVNLGQPRLVIRVQTSVPRYAQGGCTAVRVSTQVALDRDFNACVYQPGDEWSDLPHWACAVDPFNATQYVMVYTEEQSPSCAIEVFADEFKPCGYHGLPFAGRYWASTQFRGQGQYREPQSISFAPFGCTNTECMCDADHTGALCAYGKSGFRKGLSGNYSAVVCGETTLPQRGIPGPTACQCFQNEEVTFVGDACECARVGQNKTMCAGHGTCVPAAFKLGSCSVDLATFLADPLSNPFSNVSQAVGQLPVFTFYSREGVVDGDARSVVQFEFNSWLLNDGQELAMSSVAGTVISVCSPRMRFPVSVSYTCPDDIEPPVRAAANVTILAADEYGASYTYLQLCDPAAYTDEEGLLCDARVYCEPGWGSVLPPGEPRCIQSQSWVALESLDQVLITGNYTNVTVLCGSANLTNSPLVQFPFGIFDCSIPTHRVFDDQLVKLGYQRQCSYPITEYSNTIGEMYGLMWESGPFSFRGEFGQEQAQFVAAFLNGSICSKQVWSPPLMDTYLATWVQSAVGTETTTLSNTPAVTTDTNFTNYLRDFYFVGAFGSEVLANLGTWPNLTANFTFPTRAGLATTLPVAGVEIRQYAFIAPVPLVGAQVYGSQGVQCATYLRPIAAGETVVLDCLQAFVPVSNATALALILYNSTWPNKTQVAQAWAAETQTNVLWYAQVDSTVYTPITNFSIVSRPDGYQALWDQITFNIYVNRQFPPNGPYLDACAAAGGTIRAANLSVDRQYLSDFWHTWLAPRRCSFDLNCATFGFGTCVYDPQPNVGWRSGDPSTEVSPQTEGGVIGDEGGCACDRSFVEGYWRPEFFCAQCLQSYGPSSAREAQFAELYQLQIQNRTGNSSFYPLYDPNEINITQLCAYPADTGVTRDTFICGGVGTVRVERERQNYTALVFPVQGAQLVRRCTGIVLDGRYYYQLQNLTSSVSIMAYTNGTSEISVLNEQVYLDSVPVDLLGCNELTSCRYGLQPLFEVTVDCREPITSDVFSVEWQGVSFTAASFWTSYKISA